MVPAAQVCNRAAQKAKAKGTHVQILPGPPREFNLILGNLVRLSQNEKFKKKRGGGSSNLYKAMGSILGTEKKFHSLSA